MNLDLFFWEDMHDLLNDKFQNNAFIVTQY